MIDETVALIVKGYSRVPLKRNQQTRGKRGSTHGVIYMSTMLMLSLSLHDKNDDACTVNVWAARKIQEKLNKGRWGDEKCVFLRLDSLTK